MLAGMQASILHESTGMAGNGATLWSLSNSGSVPQIAQRWRQSGTRSQWQWEPQSAGSSMA